jgi:hypothetical protein
LAIFRRKLRVAILLLVVGMTPTGNRDAGKFPADTTQLQLSALTDDAVLRSGG